jgi:LmbE family N-acetylglucosaminyl deacetylase/SAM-dependent methyltransferase
MDAARIEREPASPLPRHARIALEHFRRHALPAGSRVLVLCDETRGLEEVLRRRGLDAASGHDLAQLEFPAQSFDAALIAGLLERTEWDRWGLQQVHRVLKPGAPLVLVVPNLFCLSTLADPGYAAGLLRKRAGGLIRRWLRRPPAPPPPFTRRKYRARALADVLERLGFRVTGVYADASASPEPRRAGPGWKHLFVPTWTVASRREPSLIGRSAGRPWPEPAAFRARFEREHHAMVAARDRWAAANPDRFAGAPAALDPSAYAGANVLVLAPHPDDEILGCGGTLARLIARGARVTVVHATDGSEAASLLRSPEGVRRSVRLDEAQAVGRAMGFSSLVLWKEDNAGFRARDELVGRLCRTIAELDPALVFVPFLTDIHPDHRVLAGLLGRALRALGRPSRAEILSYQVWCLVPPNRYCEVTDVASTIEDALLLYVTAMKVEDYIHLAQDRNYYNACTLMGGPGFAEAYCAMEAGAYPDLVASMESDRG